MQITLGLIDRMENCEFAFIALMIKIVLGLTNKLSQFLQQKDQCMLSSSRVYVKFWMLIM